jgi:hypothetical protein
VTKTVLSYMDKVTLLRFIGDGTDLGANATALEGEIGGSINESINRAIDIAVQAAVVNTIHEGARKGHWTFQEVKPAEITPVKVEKKDELVQTQTPANAQDFSAAPSDKSSDGKDVK